MFKKILDELAYVAGLIAALLLVALASNGCNPHANDGNNNTSFSTTRISSVGYISALTSETAGAEDDFAPASYDAVYDVRFTGGVAIVTGSEDLEVDGPSNVEIWEVPTDKVTQFETLIRTYITNQTWVPDLFPTSISSAGDLKAMLTAFSCGIDLPEFSPFQCPDEYIPDTLFRKVGTGYYFWRNPEAVKVLFLVRR